MITDPFFAARPPTPDELVRCAEALTRHANDSLDATKTRVVHSSGVRWCNGYFVHPLLCSHVGTKVQVASTEDPDRIEVYLDEMWLCTALDRDALPAELWEVVLITRFGWLGYLGDDSHLRERQP
jgi:hypothetical protein